MAIERRIRARAAAPHDRALRGAAFPRIAVAIALALATPACSRSKSADPAASNDAGPESAAAAAPTASAAPTATAEAKSPEERAPEGRPEPPSGYVAMRVMAVVSTPHGSAVLLVDPAEEKVVPIFVGGTEALSIELRLDGKRYQRPLTHDLLDALVGKLGGELVKVQVDELRSKVFIGSVYVRQGGKLVTVDARPSDAIALALGRDAPIFVATKILDVSAINKRDMIREGDDPERARLPPGHPEPMAL
jgi:bifunctional DNase/RNase